MLTSRQFPLSAYQRDIWAAESVATADPQFNVLVHERLDGELDTDVLRESLRYVLEANDAFSLRFDDTDGVPRQWFASEDAAPPVEYVDLSDAPAPAAACAAWQRNSFNQPFTLRRSRLFTAAVLRESERVVHLHLTVHHVIADAWALTLVLRQVHDEYLRRTGTTPAAPAASAPSVTTLLDAEAAYRSSA
ncbi:hypothetical protein GT043_30415, partial [Streptomyces sp. SID2131]|nr:hypothetical protein [Streptomyces sp. SID2131]